MSEKAAGNAGRIRVGCKCKAHLDEDCKCEGVIRFTLSKWEVDFDRNEKADGND